jgi:hypothetical protein
MNFNDIPLLAPENLRDSTLREFCVHGMINVIERPVRIKVRSCRIRTKFAEYENSDIVILFRAIVSRVPDCVVMFGHFGGAD